MGTACRYLSCTAGALGPWTRLAELRIGFECGLRLEVNQGAPERRVSRQRELQVPRLEAQEQYRNLPGLGPGQ